MDALLLAAATQFKMRRGRCGNFAPDGAPAPRGEYEAKEPPPTRLIYTNLLPPPAAASVADSSAKDFIPEEDSD